MKLGIFAPFGGPFATPELVTTVAREAEARGFDSLWVAEHVVLFDDYASAYPYSPDGKIPAPPESGILEPFSTLAFMAAVTSTIRLGTGICLLPQRNPVYTAKEVGNIDWLSAGRVDLGIGVGWLREEYDVVNVPWEQRGRRADEYLEVLKTLWCDDVSSYEGETYRLPPCRMYPKPVQRPHPPIHVGGESDAALRRVARHAQGWYGFRLQPEDVPERLGVLEKLLAEQGRARDEIEVSVCPYFDGIDPDKVTRYADAGVDRVIVLALALEPGQVGSVLDDLVPCLEAASAAS
jgi:probable F420-dependent oxidoreductase